MSDRPLPTFAQLGLPPILVHALGRAGISAPFPIQLPPFPTSSPGRDVLGRGPTGSGKPWRSVCRCWCASRAGRVGRRVRARWSWPPPASWPHRSRKRWTNRLSRWVCGRPRSSAGSFRRRRLSSSHARRRRDRDTGPARRPRVPGDDHARRRPHHHHRRRGRPHGRAGVSCRRSRDPGPHPETAQRLLFSAPSTARWGETLVGATCTTRSRTRPRGRRRRRDSMEQHHVLHVPREIKYPTVARIAARKGRTLLFRPTKAGVDRLTDEFAGGRIAAGRPARRQAAGPTAPGCSPSSPRDPAVLVATDVAARGIPRRRRLARRARRPAHRTQGVPAPRGPHRPPGSRVSW